ncbi:MAG: transposase [Candidatus Bathyarchaeia archaeon]
MGGLDSGVHASYSLLYHLVWAPKYRRRVLEGKVGERVKQVIEEVSARYGCKVETLRGRLENRLK